MLVCYSANIVNEDQEREKKSIGGMFGERLKSGLKKMADTKLDWVRVRGSIWVIPLGHC